MKYIQLTIRNADIFQELNKITAYSGAKNESNASSDTIDRVTAVQEDLVLIDRYREMACSSLVDSLKEFVSSADFSGDALQLTLEASGAYDDALTPALRSDIFSFITADIAARWFAMTWKEKCEEYKNEALKFLADAGRKLHHRLPPRRKSKSPV
ncbi:MAG: hypothetical protein K2I16_10880 [Muribaculaceae bacterium]|nr:hypothetical protein [Muribaculaceae bacterium]